MATFQDVKHLVTRLNEICNPHDTQTVLTYSLIHEGSDVYSVAVWDNGKEVGTLCMGPLSELDIWLRGYSKGYRGGLCHFDNE